MNKLSRTITTHTKLITALFLALAAICAFLSTGVNINYNLVDYLPKDSQSTTALNLMKSEFQEPIPNARVMLSSVSIQEALSVKESIAALDGITDVTWLDDVVDVKKPLEVADADMVEAYYKDSNALISLTIESGREVPILRELRTHVPEGTAISGEAIDKATAQEMAGSQTALAMLILVPVIIVILLISTSSWVEPILFLAAIGVSVLMNMGISIFSGEVSFITRSISPILQMAVSLDYAIFLLHSFDDFRKETDDAKEAMRLAMKRALSTIAASAATTLFGFVALAFMDFTLGSDLGLNLMKGILLSFLCVMVFLPALTLTLYKFIDRTKHKKLLPDFKNVGKYVKKLRVPALILVILVIAPAFLAQGANSFLYGSSGLDPNSQGSKDAQAINEAFGESTAIVLLVPKGDAGREALLCKAIEDEPHVSSVISYATMVSAVIPDRYLDASITERFYSESHCRIIVYTDTSPEGDAAFRTVERVQGLAKDYYGDSVYSCGASVNLYDMKNVIETDNSRVNLIAIISIAMVILLTFRSLSLPVLLVLTIETAIWINLSITYFSGDAMRYIGYLVISTVQLGATVDYAILLSDNYMLSRKTLPKEAAMHKTLGDTFSSILVSAAILSGAGFCLALTSSNPIIQQMGTLLGRGTLLSMVLVVVFLPAALVLCDRIIEKTTFRPKFFKEKKL